MQFATKKLDFSEDQIVLYAWSIGGFPGIIIYGLFFFIKIFSILDFVKISQFEEFYS